MDSKTTTTVVQRLTGAINPLGDASVDGIRFDNLKTLTEVTENLLGMIQHVDRTYRQSPAHSEQKAGEFAGQFLERIKQEI